VILQLSTVDADEVFLQLVVEQENKQLGASFPIDSLIVLAALREQKRLDILTLARLIQRDEGQARRTLESLVEAGLVQSHGTTRNRSYTLSADLYRLKGEQVAFTRQAGFSNLQHEQLVLNHARHHGAIRRSEVMELCHLSTNQAAKLLKRLNSEGKLQLHGSKRGSFYTLKNEPI
jgi:ATP-dependent DNA helicase RecG